MEDILNRLRSEKLPSVSRDGGRTSQIDFNQILAERHEAAAIIEAQQALIDRLQLRDQPPVRTWASCH
ncbi:MAG: hypothetical protein CML50_14170 [Rhodobacteraceae bacterium]|jgi:hypothetical protein|uniref:Uncharacterized protein n=1 Tax=Salipiger profundus TaxID=1229727 RepID=A0A1U7D6C1_9RHOB|nr:MULTISPECIES: hypothetical protein [Salipiger]APX23701.1 hypothetical protein Ga0080559_TMP2905 [Salipiger profundus]MAB07140.1 hypothetical protein [Paracoccaceae bacterium]GGA17328.1 hypothetical protein GCM10011326_32340 [Salipiger profundus]SFD31377.1 hypothetical protein SAMN05444415_109168 [Salipiger profundus]|tara:strand:- start:115 stop:318 length:204 start_codon:yes stop_codon:yes gene_type:complete